ncbi:GIY-YIG nuclease family protein [Streptomyces bungoensis]|uniref:GIY-YIG nuclease family protein n=1 Tax=Streptomyces bungoensis TaxID=285568 RepID=UPI00343DB2D3
MGSGKRLTFGQAGEAKISQWMADNARVCWAEHDEPWTLESELISQLDLPLNLDQNGHNAFHAQLKEVRARARQRARERRTGVHWGGHDPGAEAGPRARCPKWVGLAIELLKRVSQVRILPGAPSTRPWTDHGSGPLILACGSDIPTSARPTRYRSSSRSWRASDGRPGRATLWQGCFHLVLFVAYLVSAVALQRHRLPPLGTCRPGPGSTLPPPPGASELGRLGCRRPSRWR